LIEMPKGCLATIIETCMNGMYSEEWKWYVIVCMSCLSVTTLLKPLYRFTVLRPAKEFFTDMETPPSLVKSCKI
jgi:hypothetical protein